MLYLVSIAVAILGLLLAWLLRRGEWIFLVLGLFFLAEGVYYLYLTAPWRPGEETGPLDFLLGFSVLGIPLSVLCFSIFFVWLGGRSGPRSVELAQYAVCLLLHVLNFAVAMLSPWSEITRFGGAALAVGFGLWNFARGLGFIDLGMAHR